MRYVLPFVIVVVLGGCQRDSGAVLTPKMILVLDVDPVLDTDNESSPFFDWHGRPVSLPIAIHLDGQSDFELEMKPFVSVRIGAEKSRIHFPGNQDVQCVQVASFVMFAEGTSGADVTSIAYQRLATKPSQTPRRGHVSEAEIRKMLETIPRLDAGAKTSVDQSMDPSGNGGRDVD